jgi:hypothetical protein
MAIGTRPCDRKFAMGALVARFGWKATAGGLPDRKAAAAGLVLC